MRIRTLLENQGTPGWETLDYLVDVSWAENAPSITITNWNQSTCYANTNASSSNLLHKDQDIPLKLETVVMDLHSYGYTNTVVLTDNLGVEHPFSHYSSSSVGKQYVVVASDYGAEYFNKVQLSASGYNLKATTIWANQLGRKEYRPDGESDIEYLESTGIQYINTDIIPDANTGIRIKAEAINSIEAYVVGLRNNSDNTRWCIAHSTRYYYGYGTWASNSTASNFNIVDLNYLNDKKYSRRDLNGTVIDYLNLPTLSFTPAYPIWIFAGSGSYNIKWSGRIYYVKITQGNEIIMDLVPVRRDQVGYLYDKVSGKLFGNSGKGNFILGPDK